MIEILREPFPNPPSKSVCKHITVVFKSLCDQFQMTGALWPKIIGHIPKAHAAVVINHRVNICHRNVVGICHTSITKLITPLFYQKNRRNRHLIYLLIENLYAQTVAWTIGEREIYPQIPLITSFSAALGF
jgi:hypothetical protein